MFARILVTFVALFASTAVFATADDDSRSCEPRISTVRSESGPTIDELRRNFIGADAPPVTWAEDTRRTFVAAKFKLDGEGGYKVVLKNYPGVEFDWDSANDQLRFRIIRQLSQLRSTGATESAALDIHGDFRHRPNASSIVSIDAFENLDSF